MPRRSRIPPSILILKERSVSKDEAEAGMKEMSEKFHALGDQVYIDAENGKASNKAL